MPVEWIEHLPEIVGGIVLAGFAWGFRNWSNTLEKTSDKILNKLENLQTTFTEHRLATEKRVTRVEAELEAVQKVVDKACLRIEKSKNNPEN